MAYMHLTAGERYQISALLGKGSTLKEIGLLVGRNVSTVSREIRRNRGERGYRPKQAQDFAEKRQKETCNAYQIPHDLWAQAETMLRLDFSPEQVSGRLKLKTGQCISHETIYLRIYADKRAGGDLHTHLRCQKKRRKRYASGRSRRGHIPNRVGIEHRCPRVEDRAIIGHWESDTVIGRSHKGALVTHVERKSRFTKIRKVKRKTASEVSAATIELLKPYAELVRTLTKDNGLEFASHATVAKALNAKVYFAHPYSSWERGTNENTNGLIRQYLPKKTSFEGLTHQQVSFIEHRLNHRPRKCLDYRTPHEVFHASAKSRGVALRP